MGRGAVGRLTVRAVDLASGREARGVGEVCWTCRDEGDPGPGAAWEANEQGIWVSGATSPEATTSAAFRGAYRWELDDGALLVSHLRRGADRPARLVRLVPTGPGRLGSERPHRCGRDRYELEVRVVEGGMGLRWTIHGARKRMRLALQYGTPAPAPILPISRTVEGEPAVPRRVRRADRGVTPRPGVAHACRM